MLSTLLEVHVFFRHGDRTPDKECIYPNDPHKDFSYFPFGHGQLINKGKQRAYALGKILRDKYGDFLGDVYTPEIIESWCSPFDRTKMTLQLVQAALFPPKGDQVWNEGLLWQPIPYNSFSRMDDKLFVSVLYNTDAVKAYEDYLTGPGKTIVESQSGIFHYLQENSGSEIKTPKQALLLISALLSQKSIGLKLPSWAENISPEAVMDLIQCEYGFQTATPKLKYFAVGKLLERIVGNTRAKVDGKSKRKLHLYSGHEFSLAGLLRCLKTSKLQMPSFCANLIFELHNIDGVHGFKVYFQSNLDQPAELLSLGDFGTFCPFEDFVWLIQDILDEKHLNPRF